MSMYKYKALNEEGQVVRGTLDAANEHELEARIQSMSMELLTMSKTKQSANRLTGHKITRQELINFCFHVEQMTRAGVPLLESLTDLRDSLENPRFKEVLSSVINSIEGGKRFSEALAMHPTIFDTIFVSLIEAGEESGELDQVMRKMTESLKWQDELIATTKKLIRYPAFVGTVVLAVVFFLMIYLVPQMVSFIQSMGGDLPGHTRALIATSGFFIEYWYLVLASPFVIFFSVKTLAKTNPAFRYKLDGFKLRVWLVGPVLKKIILARFATYFSLLYRSGVNILSCLKISEEISGNTVIKRALEQVGEQTANGTSLTESIRNAEIFPPLVIRMLKVGENTGRLDSALDNVSYFYNREVKESIDKVQGMIEPVMTVVLGLILGWVMLSVLGPIYDIISKVQS